MTELPSVVLLVPSSKCRDLQALLLLHLDLQHSHKQKKQYKLRLYILQTDRVNVNVVLSDTNIMKSTHTPILSFVVTYSCYCFKLRSMEGNCVRSTVKIYRVSVWKSVTFWRTHFWAKSSAFWSHSAPTTVLSWARQEDDSKLGTHSYFWKMKCIIKLKTIFEPEADSSGSYSY